MLNLEKNKFVIMITQIRGRLIEKSPTELVVDCNGIGYSINISLNTFSKIGNEENIKLYTHLIIKEDSHSLYGFFEKSERSLFKLLISVSGVGASTGRMMLSSLTPNEIVSAIMTENVQVIQSIKGIGLKTSQRVILELKDKISVEDIDRDKISSVYDNTIRDEALSALSSLGISKKIVERHINDILQRENDISLENLIKEVLKRS